MVAKSIDDWLREAEADAPPYVCPMEGCVREFAGPTALRLHLEDHHDRVASKAFKPKGPAGFPCPECERFFTSREERMDHVAEVHQEAEEGAMEGTPGTHECKTCGRKFDTPRGLKRHRTVAHDLGKVAGRPGKKGSGKAAPAARPTGRSRRGDRNDARRELEAAYQLDGARQTALSICGYLREEAGWELASGNEIDVLMAVLHAQRVVAKEA